MRYFISDANYSLEKKMEILSDTVKHHTDNLRRMSNFKVFKI